MIAEGCAMMMLTIRTGTRVNTVCWIICGTETVPYCKKNDDMLWHGREQFSLARLIQIGFLEIYAIVLFKLVPFVETPLAPSMLCEKNQYKIAQDKKRQNLSNACICCPQEFGKRKRTTAKNTNLHALQSHVPNQCRQ